MQLMNRLAGGAAIAVLALASASAVYAQETTGAIRGRITNEAGEPVANASVTVRHDPTGTTATAMTNADGSYNSRGLRVGGPYTVTASAPQLESGKIVIPAIGISDAGQGDITLYSTASVDELVVTAAAGEGSNAQGLGSRYGLVTLETMPSASRDPKEFARLNPFVTLELSNNDSLIVAGANPKYNSLTVDGVTQNDDFGLNSTGYPTQRSPISVDAIQALEVNVAPYSVEYNKFTGANLNAVTKSGTNEFHGSLFYEFGDDSMAASRQLNRFGTYSTTGAFETTVKGATFGGPIIKDKLFFFLSYEETEASTPLTHGPVGLSRPITPGTMTIAQLQTIQTALNTTYGFTYDTDNSILDDSVFVDEDKKWLAKIDWNITDTQRVVFNYQLTEGNKISIGDAPSAGGTFPFASNFYNKSERLETYGLALFSNWTPNLSTELTWNHKEVLTQQVPVAGCADGPQGNGDEECEFAQVEILNVGTTTVFAGPDRSRHGNELTNELETYGLKAEYTWGDHTFLVGNLYEQYEAMNLFSSQSEARVTFSSLANFQAGNASRIRYQMAFRDGNGDGFRNEEDARIFMDYTLNSLFVQDTWQVTPDFTLLFGLRYETYGADKKPNSNINFKNRYGFANDATLDGLDVLLPRLSFNWQPEDSLTISGGIGLFSGGSPNVWVANSFSNDGTTLTTLDCSQTGAPSTICPATVKTYLGNVLAGGATLYNLPLAVENYFAGVTIASDAVVYGPTNAIAPGFEVPTSWKASLSIDKRIDFGESDALSNWNFGVDILLTEVNKGITWHDYRAGVSPCGTAPDGRPVYLGSGICKFNLPIGVLAVDRPGPVGSPSPNQDLVLVNTKEGHNNALAFRVAKTFDWGLAVRGSYTNTDATDVNPGLSSVAFSNWSNSATSDVNGLTASRSNYEIEHSFKLDVSYKKKFFGDNWTRISLFGEYRSGYPYSLVFNTSGSTCTAAQFNSNTCMFGDTSSTSTTFDRQLIYVPLAGVDPNVVYTGVTAAQVDAFIKQNDLEGYRGSIVPRNSQTADWVTRVDLRLSQEIPAFFPNGSKLEAFLDIRNLGNLINDDWGVQEQVEFPYVADSITARMQSCAPAGTATCPAGGYQYVYTAVQNPALDTANSTAPRRSSWAAKIGLKYKF